jgi:S1-C subfamily serine protease
MEDLNKTQIVLLSLLVSFVGSIATSIITYSMLEEAPPIVTRTVNRVVERTIETVIPAESDSNDTVREVTVVVQEEDLVIDAIAKNEKSIVRIWQRSSAEDSGGTFQGVGIILGKDFIASPKFEINQGLSYVANLHDGSEIGLDYVSSSENFSFFRTSEETELSSAILAESNVLQLGQTVILIKGQERNTISLGRITGLIKSEPQQEGGNTTISLIETDMTLVEGVKGGPVVNLMGEIVGLNIDGSADFTPISILRSDASGIN